VLEKYGLILDMDKTMLFQNPHLGDFIKVVKGELKTIT